MRYYWSQTRRRSRLQVRTLDRTKVISLEGAVLLVSIFVVLVAWNTGPFFYHFGDEGLIAWYSYIQLFATALAALFVCRALEKSSSVPWRRNREARPFFISFLGFLYLGLDEACSIHEGIDKLIHKILGMKETMWTDHIDDFILLFYGIIALFFIRDFYKEFRKYPFMIGLIAVGLVSFFGMSAMDYLSNNVETFIHFFGRFLSGDMMHKRDILRMAEESLQLFGEACFLAAFTGALFSVRKEEK